MADKIKFKYVFIPADTTEEIQELDMVVTAENEVLGFLDKLKKHFAANGPEKTAAQKQAQMQALMQSLGQDASKNVTPELLETASGLQLVENIALLANSKDNGYIGINMYCDDEGRIKELPANPRASELTACCGRAMDVRGDVFLGRIFDNEDDFKRLDFTLGDLSSSAPWMNQAREQNIRKQERGPPEVIMEQIKERAASNKTAGSNGASATPAEREKDLGNAAFQKAKWQEAVDHYTEAVRLDPQLTAAHNNRAMAHLKLGEWAAALSDSTKVLKLEPNNVKAMLRQAFAYNALGDGEKALVGYERVLELQPENKEAQEQVLRLKGAGQVE